MKNSFRSLYLAGFAGSIALVNPQLAIATEVTELATVGQIQDVEPAATTVQEWSVQIAQAEIIEITNIQIQQTEQGIELLLETNGELAVADVFTDANELVAQIPNARLNLADGEEFVADAPIAGIDFVEIIELEGDRVQIVVAGIDAAPEAEINQTPTGLALSLVTGDAVADADSEEDTDIELVVTGDQIGSDYYVTHATSATRTDSPLRDVPQSIQVIPRQIIEDQQLLRVEEAVENVGGVTFLGNNDGRGLNFAIRGFDNVPVLLDGFRLFDGDSVEAEVAGLERIEVLKGPASVLFGQSEPGGLINLVSKKPLPEPYYNLTFQAGNRGLISPSIDLSGPLTEDGRVLYRFNALYRREDSFRDLDNSFNRLFVAPKLSWAINEDTDITIGLEYINDQDPADFGTVALGAGVANIPSERITNNPEDTLEKDYLNIGYDLEHRFSENWKLRNAFRFISDEFKFGLLALPFSLDDETGVLTRVFADQAAQNDVYALYTNVQGTFNTGAIEHNLLVGVDLTRLENTITGRFSPEPTFFSLIDIFNPDYGATPKPPLEDVPLFFNGTSITKQVGIYLQDQIYLSDNLIVLAGLRYDIVDLESTNRLEGTRTSQNDSAVTPRIGIVYQPSDRIALYANYSQSFIPSTAIDAQGETLEPEEGEGFEFGVKADIIKDRLSATLAYFDITKSNVATADPDIPFATVATGEQRSRGIDLDIVGEILPGWNVIASYAYIDAEVTADNTDILGNRLSGVPEHSASLWTTYEIQSGNLQGLGFGIGFNYVGDRQGDLANSFSVGDYFLTNAAIFYGRDNWKLRVNINNLFDNDYIEAANNGRTRGIYPGEPFTIRASISVDF
ncbi:TonB-dependent siderophore receptor [Thalassoporum mexicanum PCC 7367]|uniref:TonB-dependent siderophore receptor n=1 Tax=Thalassoporum mexicanum TaxID=3457544 RepID=UPI00029FE353|nr:TonB-dependent siderophore receptor [Pseudanabaena sp. PCC 7367]AFY71447.1 TonB-dependent siderophore receptor [Pseudanabaena sp. PCC 7367]